MKTKPIAANRVLRFWLIQIITDGFASIVNVFLINA